MANNYETDDLRVAIGSLLQRVGAEVEAWKASGGMILTDEAYTVRPDLSLRYWDNTELFRFPIEEKIEKSWDHNNLELFLDSQIKPTPEYSVAIRVAGENPRSEGLLKTFASCVARNYAVGSDGPKLDAYVDTLLRDLKGIAPDFTAKIWVAGITIEQDVLRVSETLTLRKPVRTNVQEEILNRLLHYQHLFNQPADFSSVAELRVLASQPVEVQQQIDRLVTAMRLFRLGSVSSSRYEFESVSFAHLGRARIGGPSRPARVQYVISAPDGPRIARFLKTIQPLLPSSYDLPSITPTFLSTALNWYSESLLATGPTEGTIAWAVACLEALFLGDNPNSELSYRLKLRTASMLRCFGWKPLEVRKNVGDAYEIRSRYVHGAVPSKKISREQLTALFRSVAEYARVCCLAWAQLVTQTGQTRTDILRDLDDALIDDDTRARLQDRCNLADFVRSF